VSTCVNGNCVWDEDDHGCELMDGGAGVNRRLGLGSPTQRAVSQMAMSLIHYYGSTGRHIYRADAMVAAADLSCSVSQ
jgi:hypothetical protein